MDENKQYAEIDILKLISAVLRRWWFVLICLVIAAGLAFGITKFFITPKYQSSAMLYVNNTSSIGGTKIQLSSSDLTASKSLVNTYSIILTSRLTLEEVIDKLDLKYSYEQLKSMITISSVNSTEVFSVKVVSAEPSEAAAIANAIVELATTSNANDNVISKVVEGSSARAVDMAVVSSNPISPNVSRNVLIGAAAGFVFACLIIVVIELMNDTIDDENWVTETFGEEIPTLAIIPDSLEEGSGKYGYSRKYYKNYYKDYYSSNSRPSTSAKDKSAS